MVAGCVLVSLVIAVSTLVPLAVASLGDRSYVYQKCRQACVYTNCTGKSLEQFKNEQPLSHRLLQWSCQDECQYTCMWITVDAFQRDDLDVPQFHGKWPFVRVLGIQEPASMIFSVLNGLAHFGIFKYRQLVPATTPMYYVWHGAAMTAMNAWFWSTVFHSKDTDFTEKMDYFCAFSIVLFNTFTLACRLCGTHNWRRPLAVAVVCIVFYVHHIHYLTFNKFDYGYNMEVNVGVAIFNMIGWLFFCYMNRRRKYVWKAVLSIVGIQLLLCLELGDFVPFFWTFDAHSLWHAGTPPLALLWYSFIIDDAQYLMSSDLPHKMD